MFSSHLQSAHLYFQHDWNENKVDTSACQQVITLSQGLSQTIQQLRLQQMLSFRDTTVIKDYNCHNQVRMNHNMATMLTSGLSENIP